MKQKDPLLINETSPVQWSIVVNSIHVLAYKLWIKAKNDEEWQVLSEGTSTDNIADTGSFDASKNMEFSYWLGIGSTQGLSNFNIAIVLAQDGKVLENGLMHEIGKVNKEGVARRLEIVKFLD